MDEINQKRLEIFNQTSEDLLRAGYMKTALTTTAEKASRDGALYSLILSAPFVIAFLLTYNQPLFGFDAHFFIRLIIFLLIVFGLVIVHELIHGLTWSFFTRAGFKSISFGMIWEMMTPYCTCRKPLKKAQYVTGAIMPCLILGIIPCIAACLYSLVCRAWRSSSGGRTRIRPEAGRIPPKARAPIVRWHLKEAGCGEPANPRANLRPDEQTSHRRRCMRMSPRRAEAIGVLSTTGKGRRHLSTANKRKRCLQRNSAECEAYAGARRSFRRIWKACWYARAAMI